MRMQNGTYQQRRDDPITNKGDWKWKGLALVKGKQAINLSKGGQKPTGVMPGTKSFLLGLLGETAVDFDFGPPELGDEQLPVEEENPYFRSLTKAPIKSLTEKKGLSVNESIKNPFLNSKDAKKKKNDWMNLQWPIFILDGDGFVLMIKLDIYDGKVPKVKGPLPVWPRYENKYTNPACAIMCMPCTPPILCIATINGTIFHSIVLPVNPNDERMKTFKKDTEYSDPPDRAIYIFEGLGLELGLAATEKIPDYTCPIFLHPDESRLGHYFATHEGGVHSVILPAVDSLQQYLKGPGDDDLLNLIVNQPSTADYLVCTKLASSNEKLNPVIGFGVYYDPTSIISLLANGQVVSSLIASFASLPYTEDLMPEDIENFNSPLKKMLSEPFDLQIQKILKQASSQPILKISGNTERTQQECYELLQRASQVFREEHFKHHERAREEIEKRIKVLQMLKNYQTAELKRLNEEKQVLQEKAESLAEKYEDIKDKQEDLKKRCERLLILVSKKKSEPSEAEKNFLKELKRSQNKVNKFESLIHSLKNQMKYQEVQMTNWNKEMSKKETGLGSFQSQALKTNLQDMTNKITEMIKEVTEYKKQLALN
ncbi:hypothetical protein ILUMI_27410 [Ignelater luminosus]|uniref:Nuclear pore complex protein Nup88 n=1 Tax=Ignelater luminosus TaxID=2038154 RepID=A0A8K0FY72_IGNLU|nr:hypothetical protein ILUMI_27410 [Ignelater luminosus]